MAGPERFLKYEGLGNDFIVVEAAAEPAGLLERAVRWCDRHFGIGADGLLVVLPPRSTGARARMLVVNADGSRPEMCGNGLRCVALHAALADGAGTASYVIDTDAGPRLCEVERNRERAVVRLSMGRAEMLGPRTVRAGDQAVTFCHVDVGNPHAVLLDSPYSPAEIDEVSPKVSAAVAGGMNVEHARMQGPRAIDVVVWERGVGRTLACGTGAVATAAAACALDRAPFDEPIEVRLPGGPLSVQVERGSWECSLTGPARLVFKGELSA